MPEPTPAERVSIPLLTLITQQSLDEDYRHVAERRASQGGGSTRRRTLGTATVVLAAFGLLVTVAAVQNSQQAGIQTASRASLIANIEERRDDVATLEERLFDLQELNVSLQDNLDDITASSQSALARVERLGVVTGLQAVTGPGVRVTVGDGPNDAVRAADLRALVDGLWNAGAEAIAINGQRLTARSGLANSGAAIRVVGNNRTLSPKYVVEAIGDRGTLQADLMQTSSGLLFRDTAARFGLPVSMDNVERLSLPAAPQRLLRMSYAVAGTAAQHKMHDKQDPRKEDMP
ncbi:DUF881 domain-containing protein [Nocardioides sp.]|uniref:DUF881 domain-containing protein n=1 Tax=Nocardioides sp. TaxID=35761 RepID=UPI0025F3C5BC|nr:DUF881 domain-containing protein [Nocardioides sp.]